MSFLFYSKLLGAKHNLRQDQSGWHADPQAVWSSSSVTLTPLVRLQVTVSSSCPGAAHHGETAGSTRDVDAEGTE